MTISKNTCVKRFNLLFIELYDGTLESIKKIEDAWILDLSDLFKLHPDYISAQWKICACKIQVRTYVDSAIWEISNSDILLDNLNRITTN